MIVDQFEAEGRHRALLGGVEFDDAGDVAAHVAGERCGVGLPAGAIGVEQTAVNGGVVGEHEHRESHGFSVTGSAPPDCRLSDPSTWPAVELAREIGAGYVRRVEAVR